MKAFIESITLNALGAATGLFIGAVSLHGQDRPPQGNWSKPRKRFVRCSQFARKPSP